MTQININAHALWISLLLVAILSPMVWWRGKRLPYAAVLSLLMLVGIVSLGMYDRHRVDEWAVSVFEWTPTFKITKRMIVSSCGYGLGIAYQRLIIKGDEFQEGRADGAGPILKCHHIETLPQGKYPEARDPLFNRWGIGLTWFNQPETANSTLVAMRGIVMPLWLVVSPFILLPILQLRRMRVRAVARRRADVGRCFTCGYDLRMHEVGDKCPECGSVHAPTVAQQ